jgi:hypothetical protein
MACPVPMTHPTKLHHTQAMLMMKIWDEISRQLTSFAALQRNLVRRDRWCDVCVLDLSTTATWPEVYYIIVAMA